MSTHPASHESGAQPFGTPQGVDLWHRVNRYISASNAPEATSEPFNGLALDLFRFQWACNTMYRAWCGHLGWTSEAVEGLDESLAERRGPTYMIARNRLPETIAEFLPENRSEHLHQLSLQREIKVRARGLCPESVCGP